MFCRGGPPRPPLVGAALEFRAGTGRLSQNSQFGRDRSTNDPHPDPLPKGEGTQKTALSGSLSPWERVGVRVHLWHDSRWSMSFETVSGGLPLRLIGALP